MRFGILFRKEKLIESGSSYFKFLNERQKMNQTLITPPHLSVSGIRELFRCGLRWYYEQLQDMRLPGAQGGPQTRGIALDRAASFHFKQKAVDGIGISKADFVDHVLEEIEASDNLTVWDLPYKEVIFLARTQAFKYWSTFGQQLQPRSAADVQKEIKILFPGMSIPVLGIVDLILEDGTIVDNKVTKRVPNIFALRANWQLSTYALLTGETHGALAIIVDLDKSATTHFLETDRSENQINIMLDRFRMAERIIMGQALMPAAEDSWFCSDKWCRFWAQCDFGEGK